MPRHWLYIRNQDAALYGGIALTLAGAAMLRQAFEDRGRPRPWIFKLFGLVT